MFFLIPVRVNVTTCFGKTIRAAHRAKTNISKMHGRNRSGQMTASARLVLSVRTTISIKVKTAHWSWPIELHHLKTRLRYKLVEIELSMHKHSLDGLQ